MDHSPFKHQGFKLGSPEKGFVQAKIGTPFGTPHASPAPAKKKSLELDREGRQALESFNLGPHACEY